MLDAAMSRALLRTTTPQYPEPDRDMGELLTLREYWLDRVTPDARLCATCDGCRWMTARRPDVFTGVEYVSEPWHLYLQRIQRGRPIHRRISWRPCPRCNPIGALGYRDPFSGQTEPPVRQ